MDVTLRTVVMGAALLGLVAGSLGCFAVLKRRSLLGDALAHAALPGVCLAFLAGRALEMDPKHPLLLLGGALCTAWIGTLLILALTRTTRIKEDAAIGIVLSVFFGFGIVLLTFIQHRGGAEQSGLNSFLFGQAATLSPRDVWIMAGLGGVALAAQLICFRLFQATVFDAEHAASIGLRVRATEVFLTSLIVVAVVVGLQTVGVVLMAAMLVAPATAARQWTDRLGRMVLLAGLLGAGSGVLGAWVSSLRAKLPTGPLIVLSASAVVVASLALAPRRGLVWAAVRRMRNRRRIRVENLLKDLWRLAESDGRFRAPRALTDVLAVRAASLGAVTDAENDRLVTREASTLRLTARGLERASQVVRNHRVWETYLSQRLELADDHLHRDAENMEHALNEEVLEQIDQALGRPACDPHGRPIPRGVPTS